MLSERHNHSGSSVLTDAHEAKPMSSGGINANDFLVSESFEFNHIYFFNFIVIWANKAHVIEDQKSSNIQVGT